MWKQAYLQYVYILWLKYRLACLQLKCLRLIWRLTSLQYITLYSILTEVQSEAAIPAVQTY
jgi:hypothetical protein